eukprot:TRINITY_DN889_c0_g1_i3.p1 TRINITY_DN889_c0_g1~~TRINITY_DN889_c0_g1_i3.p1  ORF type:complete len:213 (-),score=35.94 TRINITY_DN889_c0_g1_i3:79-717(-)
MDKVMTHPSYPGKYFYKTANNLMMTIKETQGSGKGLYQETINYLNAAGRAVPAYAKVDEGLTQISWDQAKYIVQQLPAGKNPHNNYAVATKYSIMDRAKYNDQFTGAAGVAENIASCVWGWNYNETAEMHMILRFLIDDGVSSRGHRHNIFRDHTMVGIGIFKEKSDRDKVVMLSTKGNWSCKSGKCPFAKSMRDKMCWTSYIKGRSDCTDQ